MNMELLIPKNDTLVTYYVLPLLGINKKTFGRSFKTSYIDKTGDKVFVELYHKMIAPSYKYNRAYETEVIAENINFVVFKIPPKWKPDVVFFLAGLYSRMSKEAKKIIYSTSTLQYNVKVDKFTVSHPVLQALSRTKTLRRYLTESLNVRALADSDEFLDRPKDSWFIEHRIEELKNNLKYEIQDR